MFAFSKPFLNFVLLKDCSIYYFFFKVADAKKALSNMCLMPEDTSDVKVIEPTAKGFPSDTEMEEAPRNKQSTMYILRGLPGSGKSYLAKYV